MREIATLCNQMIVSARLCNTDRCAQRNKAPLVFLSYLQGPPRSPAWGRKPPCRAILGFGGERRRSDSGTFTGGVVSRGPRTCQFIFENEIARFPTITRFLTRRLNEAKSTVDRPWKVKFLGFSFTNGREPTRRIAPKALTRFKERVREATRRTRGVSIGRMVVSLGRYLRG
jgi:hypothetical protein